MLITYDNINAEEEALEHLNEATQETANGTTATATPPPVVEAGGKMAPLVEKEVTEKEKDEESPPAASEAATVTAEQTVAPPTESSSNEQSGNTKEKEKIDEEKEAVKDGRSEEERIQELMSRSDTAVVFAEPVEDELSAGDLEEGDETDYMLKCPHCDKGFTRVYILREHIRQQHGDKVNKHTCPKCNASFVLKSQLEKHLAFHASNVQVCKVCHKTFANVYRLQRHMISHDESTDLRKFKCPECGKAFKFKHHLKEHIRIHSGEKPFECGNCGKRFSHSGSYSSHMTSKKCWVVNLKMRRGVPEKPRDQATEQMRPLVPKPGDGSLDLSSSAAYANSITEFSQQFIPYDPVTGGPISAQLLAMNGVRPPFLPYGPYSSTPIQGLRLPTAPVTSAYSPGLTVSTPSIPSHAPAAATSPSKATDVQTKELPSEEAQKTSSSSVEASENNLSSAVAEKASTNGDESIKKVLEMVDRTVAEQRACQDQKRAISKLNPAVEEPDSLAAKAKEALQQHLHKLDPTRVFSNASSPVAGNRCRYCKNTFPSPIDLHQHERYLCKQNREIPSGSESAERRGTPDSRTNGTISPTSSLGTDRTGDDEIDMSADADDFDKDNRCRVRSMFTEEQLMILRAHYDQNPRPRKYELVRIGNDIGFPKRVVQVWFQNMRARDRKRGKDVPYFPSMARPKKEPDTDQNQNQWNPGPKSSAANNSPYIPIVPKPFASNASASQQQQSPTMAAYYAAGKQAQSGSSKVTKDMQAPSYVNPQLPFSSSQDEPLDLSVSSSIKREPSHAHTPSPRPQLSEPAHSMEGEVLNLSVKSELRRKGGKDSRFETSAIFKYMQQEGMIINHHAAAEAIRRSLTPEVLRRSLTPEVFRRSFTPRRSMSPSIPLSNQAHQPRSTESSPAAHRNHQHHHPHHAHHAHHENSPIPSPISDTRETPAVHPAMEPLSVKVDMANGLANKLAMHTNGSLDSSFNSTTSAELNSSLNLSEASLEDYGRSKRARKKSWRQVEAEEMQLDQLEDSMMLGEDGQHRKKRRSWKAHKLDTEEGMYACDQCDKIFSKQSSLARHKYEHSGARPYCCDVCSKAFKHKHHLTEHKRLHSGEKPFECKKCGKRFSHSGSYSQHMNHRYKYCKPLKGEEGEMDMEMEMESS